MTSITILPNYTYKEGSLNLPALVQAFEIEIFNALKLLSMNVQSSGETISSINVYGW